MKKKLLTAVIICQVCFLMLGKDESKNEPDKIQHEVKNKEKQENEPPWSVTNLSVKEEIKIWQKAYPDVQFALDYSKEKKDWLIKVTNYGKSQIFYWVGGLYLPESELENKDKYWHVITPYKNEILDPATFSKEQAERIKNFGSSENRKNGKVSSKYIFNAIYDTSTRKSTEQHIKQIQFLNRNVNVHEYLKEPLKRVEEKINSLSQKNKDVKNFLEELSSCESYNWREIRDSNTRSFHSHGIAIDILPKHWGKKIIYWGFEKNKGNQNWMLIPVSERWMPPKEVIGIFLEEGFIWGGNWAVWDNMHFEYHPELTQFVK